MDKKILHIIDTNFSGRFFEVVIDYQASICKQVGLISLSGEYECKVQKANVHRLVKRGQKEILPLPQIVLAILRYKPDLIISHLPKSGLIVGIISRLFRKRSIYFRHYQDEHFQLNRKSVMFLDKVINVLTKEIVTMSDQTKSWMIEKENVNPDKIEVVYQALDYDNIVGNPVTIQKIRNEFDTKFNHPFIVLCVSRFSPRKNQALLVEATKLIRAADLNINLIAIFLGAGDPSWLMKVIKDSGSEEFCGIVGFKSNVFDYICAADLIVHPSTIDSFSQIIMEAQALGKAVIAAEAGSINDQVLNGVTGYVIPKDNVTELAKKIVLLIENPTLRSEMGRRAYCRVREKYPLRNMLDRLDEIVDISPNSKKI